MPQSRSNFLVVSVSTRFFIGCDGMSHLPNHVNDIVVFKMIGQIFLWNVTSVLFIYVCVCVCVNVRERERESLFRLKLAITSASFED